MTIKRLTHTKENEVSISVGRDSAIVLIEQDKAIELLLLLNPTSKELLKLKQLSNVSSFKFFGDVYLFQKIEELQLEWPNAKKTIFIEEQTEIFYNSVNKRVRIPKTIKNSTQLNKKKVLIVDDSKTIQKILKKMIEQSHLLEVGAIASSAAEAQEIIEKNPPELITLDIHMPGITGVEFLKNYLQDKNIPTVIISSLSISEGPLVLEALSSGAHTYIQKPSFEKIDEMAIETRKKLESIAISKAKRPKSLIHIKSKKYEFSHTDGVIVIGSSTGGTQALEYILTSLPDKIPPIVIVQHIPPIFSKALADRLNSLCSFHVKEAEHEDLVSANCVYIAPGQKQLKLYEKKSGVKLLEVTDDPPVNRFKPSVDYLFNSVTSIKKIRVVGIILTGMGKDGAKGLLGIKELGHPTIAQDEKSCVVFGMPRVAIELGAADQVVGLEDIPKKMTDTFNRLSGKKLT